MYQFQAYAISVTLLAAIASPQTVRAETMRPDVASATGAVYTANNSTEANEVFAYRRAANGVLTYIGTYETGGRGSGGAIDPLQSQNSILLSSDHHFLFVVDSGSGDITVFEVLSDGGLHRLSRTPSHGGFPVSLAFWGNLLYVLNSGGAGNVSGFRVFPNGELHAIAGSTQLLSGPAPARIDGFQPGRYRAGCDRALDQPH